MIDENKILGMDPEYLISINLDILFERSSIANLNYNSSISKEEIDYNLLLDLIKKNSKKENNYIVSEKVDQKLSESLTIIKYSKNKGNFMKDLFCVYVWKIIRDINNMNESISIKPTEDSSILDLSGQSLSKLPEINADENILSVNLSFNQMGII